MVRKDKAFFQSLHSFYMQEVNSVNFSSKEFNDFYMLKHGHLHFMVKEMGGVATLVFPQLIVVNVNSEIDPYRDYCGLYLNVMVIFGAREDKNGKPTTYILVQIMDNRKMKCIYLRHVRLLMVLT